MDLFFLFASILWLFCFGQQLARTVSEYRKWGQFDPNFKVTIATTPIVFTILAISYICTFIVNKLF